MKIYKSMKNDFKNQGFSLIELLVVITIIAILSGIGMISFANAGKSARDARRQSDLQAIRQALVMYRSDNGCYPAGNIDDAISELLDNGYLTEPVPVDPKSPTYEYSYDAGADTIMCVDGSTTGVTSFELEAHQEKPPSVPYKLTSP